MYEKVIASNPNWIDAQSNLIRRYLMSSFNVYQIVGLSVYESEVPTEITCQLQEADRTVQDIGLALKSSKVALNLDPSRNPTEQSPIWKVSSYDDTIYYCDVKLSGIQSLTLKDFNKGSNEILSCFNSNKILCSWTSPKDIKIRLYIKRISEILEDSEVKGLFANDLSKVMPLLGSNLNTLPNCVRSSTSEIRLSWNIPATQFEYVDSLLAELPQRVFG